VEQASGSGTLDSPPPDIALAVVDVAVDVVAQLKIKDNVCSCRVLLSGRFP
jgi:hypothetical protein